MRDRIHALKFWAALIVATIATFSAQSARAIVLDAVDDFQDGTTQSWGFSTGGSSPVGNVADAGPAGSGDRALFTDAFQFGNGKLIVINSQQWSGDWTTAEVVQVALDVRNPTASPLSMRVGVVGPGGASFGNGDGHVTQAIVVPADDQWHSIVFDVLASDLTATSTGFPNTAGALADVQEARIFSNSSNSIIGQTGGAFYLDNIRALGAVVGVSGDYNDDGVVDAADYTVWRDSLGQTGTGLAADGTGPGGSPDGVVDTLDYDFWKTNFGNPGGGGHHHGLGAATSVPEPASLVAFILGIAAMALLRHRKERAN